MFLQFAVKQRSHFGILLDRTAMLSPLFEYVPVKFGANCGIGQFFLIQKTSRRTYWFETFTTRRRAGSKYISRTCLRLGTAFPRANTYVRALVSKRFPFLSRGSGRGGNKGHLESSASISMYNVSPARAFSRSLISSQQHWILQHACEHIPWNITYVCVDVHVSAIWDIV